MVTAARAAEAQEQEELASLVVGGRGRQRSGQIANPKRKILDTQKDNR